jgi:hypothetical protein
MHALEADASGDQIADGLHQMWERASQAVELPDHQGIARSTRGPDIISGKFHAKGLSKYNFRVGDKRARGDGRSLILDKP